MSLFLCVLLCDSMVVCGGCIYVYFFVLIQNIDVFKPFCGIVVVNIVIMITNLIDISPHLRYV